MTETKTCSMCDETKEIEAFAPRYDGTGDRRANCKACQKTYLHSPLGVAKQLIRIQTARAKRFGYDAPTYSGEDLLKWMKTQRNWGNIMLQWKTSGYKMKLKPALMRKNVDLGFQLGNLELCYTMDNKERHNKETYK